MKTLAIIYKICGQEQWYTHFEFINDLYMSELEIVDKFICSLFMNSKRICYGVDNEKMSFADYIDNKKRRFEVRFFIVEDEKEKIPEETKKFINALMDRNLVH